MSFYTLVSFLCLVRVSYLLSHSFSMSNGSVNLDFSSLLWGFWLSVGPEGGWSVLESDNGLSHSCPLVGGRKEMRLKKEQSIFCEDLASLLTLLMKLLIFHLTL